MIIETTSKVEEGSYISKKDNSRVQYTDQEAYIELPGEKYPRKMRIRLERDQKLWPTGRYVLSAASFEVGQYGDLRLARIVLVPEGK